MPSNLLYMKLSTQPPTPEAQGSSTNPRAAPRCQRDQREDRGAALSQQRSHHGATLGSDQGKTREVRVRTPSVHG